jgi:hypothetical protein
MPLPVKQMKRMKVKERERIKAACNPHNLTARQFIARLVDAVWTRAEATEEWRKIQRGDYE